MLPQLLRATLDLMLLRRGPQDMPSDWGLLGGVGFVYCSLAFTQVRLVANTAPAFAQAVLATVILALFVNVILRWRGVPERFVQTLTALFAVGSLLTVLMLGPTTALLPFLESLAKADNPEAVTPPPALVLFAYAVVGLWGLVVFGHIYRHALSVNLWLGVTTALGFEILLLFVFSLLGA